MGPFGAAAAGGGTASSCRRASAQVSVAAGGQHPAPDGPFGARPEVRSQPGGAGFAIGEDGAQRGARGYDAGKKIEGRKRHIAVDTQGNLLTVVVHAASLQDRVAARAVLLRLFRQVHTIQAVIADGGYTGKLIEWTKQMFGWRRGIVKRNELHRFVVLPKRWVVERTFAWLNWSRRLSKDYKLRPTSAETMIHIAYTHLMLRRLA